jgi:hypothetical protein
MMSRKQHIPFRLKRRYQDENVRMGATSLMGLYKDGLEKQANTEPVQETGTRESQKEETLGSPRMSPKEEMKAMRAKWKPVGSDGV